MYRLEFGGVIMRAIIFDAFGTLFRVTSGGSAKTIMKNITDCGNVVDEKAFLEEWKSYYKNHTLDCQTAHCGRCKPRFVLGEFTSPIVPYRNLPQAPDGMTADCCSLV